ncbi:hypothetical protein, partial [Pseudomonas aeruginosa]|uniref:hypothetical protein n=1 Tax=Pseudomonas aeruginosa TaxID=287 RepID=UPI002155F195
TLEQRPDAERELAGRLHACSGGWVAAVVLLLDQIGRVGSYDVDRLDSREVLFPYFAQEMIGAASPELRHFLLCTAILPNFDLAEARQLTGSTDVDHFVTSAHCQQYFIDQFGSGAGASYQYHALFREFLLSRLPDAFSAD